MSAWTAILGLATLIGGAAGIWYLRDSFRRRKQTEVLEPDTGFAHRLRHRRQPKLFEILPYYFEIDLGAQIPCAEVTFYGVNHHPKRRLTIDRIVVTQLSISGGPSLENIEQRGPPRSVPPANTELAYCKKDLSDGATRELMNTQGKNSTFGSLSAYAEISGLRGSKHSHVRINAQQIVGYVRGPTVD